MLVRKPGEKSSTTNTALEETPKRTPDQQQDSSEQQVQTFPSDTPSLSSSQRHRTNHLAWMKQRLLSFSPTLVLENSGSVARDHLAAERTFLAYVRTSLGCAATGVALVQLISLTPTNVPRRLERFSKILGAVIEILGAAIMIVAVFRYFSMQKALIDGKFPTANMVVWMIVFAMAVIILVTFGLMLAIALS